ncbi:DEKNAAC102966 [Brettanomyces naardenensis]|uniref:DEKNAAC102966 n=1 Tax=Brettanomyces naardenensis TaxID=13370 RepID=A0A448YM42_BRENA|nr:DEKNAAC102966 [Brettanomyces naardenensis]
MSLHTKKHIAYFKRCLGVLPTSFESEDSNKLAVLYFSLTGLDLLGALQSSFSEKDRADFIRWIYAHAVETDKYYGFRGSMVYKDTGVYDPPNLGATCFALQSLITLGDSLDGVRKKKLMRYVVDCQRKDGSFAPILDLVTGLPFGEEDSRYCMIAATIRKVVNWQGTEYDIDIDRLCEYVRSIKAFDGGLSMGRMCESHAGLTFCGLDSLKLVARLDRRDWKDTIDFLVHRQVSYNKYNQRELEENPYGDAEDNGGFNGRLNKYADTCYVFWTINSLALLDEERLIGVNEAKDFLLTQTQNEMMGGFNKTNDSDDNYPDPLHSFLGLATLSILGFDGLDGLNSELVITERAYKKWAEIRSDKE